jgi:hypothetical protein
VSGRRELHWRASVGCAEQQPPMQVVVRKMQKQKSSQGTKVGNKSWGYHGKESKRTVVEASRPQLLLSLSLSLSWSWSCWAIEAENEMDALLRSPLVLQPACPLWPVGIFQSHRTVLTARMHFQKTPIAACADPCRRV